MERRGFLAGILALIGIGSTIKATEPTSAKPKYKYAPMAGMIGIPVSRVDTLKAELKKAEAESEAIEKLIFNDGKPDCVDTPHGPDFEKVYKLTSEGNIDAAAKELVQCQRYYQKPVGMAGLNPSRQVFPKKVILFDDRDRIDPNAPKFEKPDKPFTYEIW